MLDAEPVVQFSWNPCQQFVGPVPIRADQMRRQGRLGGADTRDMQVMDLLDAIGRFEMPANRRLVDPRRYRIGSQRHGIAEKTPGSEAAMARLTAGSSQSHPVHRIRSAATMTPIVTPVSAAI